MTERSQAAAPVHRDAVNDRPEVIDGVDVDALVAAVVSCPSVTAVLGGAVGAATTLLPGRRVPGVRLAGDEVRVEVRARWGSTAAILNREVRAATANLLAGHRLNIVIGDIDAPSPRADTEALPVTTAPDAALPAPAALAFAADVAATPAPLPTHTPLQGELS